jgi:hypothetical protein
MFRRLIAKPRNQEINIKVQDHWCHLQEKRKR